MDFAIKLLGNGDYNLVVLTGGLAVTVIGIILVVWLLKFIFEAGNRRLGGKHINRIGIVSSQPVDGKRRLIIVRRDNVGHLLMIGGPADIIIETGIDLGESVPPYPTRSKPGKSSRNTGTNEPARKPAPTTTSWQPQKVSPASVSSGPVDPTQPVHTYSEPSIAVSEHSGARKRRANHRDADDHLQVFDTGQEHHHARKGPARSTLRYPGILRPVTRHKGVDSSNITNAQTNDSDKVPAPGASKKAAQTPMVDLTQGADSDSQPPPSKPSKR